MLFLLPIRQQLQASLQIRPKNLDQKEKNQRLSAIPLLYCFNQIV